MSSWHAVHIIAIFDLMFGQILSVQATSQLFRPLCDFYCLFCCLWDFNNYLSFQVWRVHISHFIVKLLSNLPILLEEKLKRWDWRCTLNLVSTYIFWRPPLRVLFSRDAPPHPPQLIPSRSLLRMEALGRSLFLTTSLVTRQSISTDTRTTLRACLITSIKVCLNEYWYETRSNL